MLNFITYIPSIVISLYLAVIVWVKGRERNTNRVFSLMILSVSLWITTVLIADAIIIYPPNDIIWARLTIVGPIIMLPLMLVFSKIFPNAEKFPSAAKQLIIFLPTLLFIPFILTHYNVTTTSHQDWGGAIEAGPIYLLFNVYFLVYLGISFWNLLRKLKEAKGIFKQQLRYIIIGISVTAVISILFSGIFPLFGISNFSVLSPPATLIFLGATSYAIVRHQLLDIKLVISKSLVYGFILTLVTLSFVFTAFISAQFFRDTPASRNTVAFLVAALIVFGLDPLKAWLSRVTDRVFFKAKVDYQTLLREISEILAFEINRDELIRKIRAKIKDGMKVQYAVTLLRVTANGRTEKFEALPDMLHDNPSLSVQNDGPLVRFLREHKHFSLVESLERKMEDTPESERGPLIGSKEEFNRMGASLVAPIYAQGHLVAVLALGPKLSGDSFSNDDIQLIEVLSSQIGSAIQKANLFEEVRQFGESLKIKVEQATAELRERNVSLQTLQNITKEITRTLDFNRVVQRIANSVAAELGYLGAILVFLDDDSKTVRARAITETPLTKKALRLLPIHFSDYTSDITDPGSNSLGHQVIKSGEMKLTDDFAAVISPPVPKLLALTIQKVVGIKSVALIPIISEGKTIGVIEIGTRKKPTDITKQEIATMQSLADELGVVSRNIKLFDQIRKTNEQLEVANKHLQELDRAKSEFVSIASHQLRTPMTGIMGYLSMLTQGDFGKLAPEHAKILTDLLSESQRMIRLINQFLNVSKIEAGKFTYAKAPVHVEELIRREIEETAKSAKDKGLELETKLPASPLPTIVADGDKLQDVILNLIDNAIKYTTKGSITVGADSRDGQIDIWVADTGIGIKKEDTPELFNKFVRGSGIAQIHPDGSGLGLFIAKSIVDAHGGRIWAESEGEGKGSTFRLTIPIAAPAAPPGRQAAAHVGTPR